MIKEEPENQKFLLSINKTVEELLSSIEKNLPVVQYRLDKFIDVFDKEFTYDTKPEDREAVTIFIEHTYIPIIDATAKWFNNHI